MRGECGDIIIIVEDVVILFGRSGYEESTGIERRFDIMGFRIGVEVLKIKWLVMGWSHLCLPSVRDIRNIASLSVD